MVYTNLKKYGLSDRFEQEATMYGGFALARITEQHRDLYKAVREDGYAKAVVSGKLRYSSGSALDFPAVGDWVMLEDDGTDGNAVIHHVLTRSSVFVRQAAGTAGDAQVVAANIDVVFICMSLNADFNLRRLERYLTVAWDSRAKPAIVLTKSDLCEDLAERLVEVEGVSMGVPIVVCSSENGDGFDEVSARIGTGKTAAFIGSSGVGKSTMINRLLGENALATQAIREGDGKGRHTTTHRQLLLLLNGGIVIDTPGMRELSLYSGDVSRTFEDIEDLATQCKFSNCTHSDEPGCAVRAAIADGSLAEKRFGNYQKLGREINYEGLNSREREQEKINRMFGGKKALKNFQKSLKKK
ncbi:MAG: ribosome small subunit-dependent GTPase A [Gracilibacteraceae bacterium]|jgi:ribosome biogenesis GTPase|nr:ribosome small subunit-dependent GTPase A [Gracilibacteraceae bacterium]